MSKENRAIQIVSDIISDLTDRRGLRHQWDRIDNVTRQQIVERWKEIVLDHLRRVEAA